MEVTCNFAVDNVPLLVQYNGNPLEIYGDVMDSRAMKTITFFDKAIEENELRIESENVGSCGDPNCIWSGLLLHCLAKDAESGVAATYSPWHNFTSNPRSGHWRSEDGAVLLTNHQNFIEPNNTAVGNLVAIGASKIWSGEQNRSVFIGTPGSSEVEVQCQFTVVNEAVGVEYSGMQLNINGDVADWRDMKTFTFVHNTTSENVMMIKAENWGPKPYCMWAGLLLHCQARSVHSRMIAFDNPWHDFTSNLEQWRTEDGSKMCADGMISVGSNDSTIQTLVSKGAVRIWGGEHNTSTLIGSPGFKHTTTEIPTTTKSTTDKASTTTFMETAELIQEESSGSSAKNTTCSMLPSQINSVGYVSCFLETVFGIGSLG